MQSEMKDVISYTVFAPLHEEKKWKLAGAEEKSDKPGK